MRIIFGSLAVILAFAAAPAFAQGAAAQGTAAQRAACESDAYRFCDAYVPDAVAIERCLRANVAQLSAGCKAEFGIASGGKGKRRR